MGMVSTMGFVTVVGSTMSRGFPVGIRSARCMT